MCLPTSMKGTTVSTSYAIIFESDYIINNYGFAFESLASASTRRGRSSAYRVLCESHFQEYF